MDAEERKRVVASTLRALAQHVEVGAVSPSGQILVARMLEVLTAAEAETLEGFCMVAMMTPQDENDRDGVCILIPPPEDGISASYELAGRIDMVRLTLLSDAANQEVAMNADTQIQNPYMVCEDCGQIHDEDGSPGSNGAAH